MTTARRAVTHPHVVLVEGETDREIIRRLLGKRDDLQVVSFKQEGTLRGRLIATVSTARIRLKSVGIVIDADDGPAGAKQRAIDALRRGGLTAADQAGVVHPGKPRTGVWIVPDNRNSGSLETLFRRSLAGTADARCVDEFLDCIRAARGREHWSTRNRRDKAFAYAWAAAQARPTKDLAVATRQSAWNLDAAAWSPLRAFLQELTAGQ